MSLSTYLNIVHQRTLSRVTKELADTLTASDAADWSDVWAGLSASGFSVLKALLTFYKLCVRNCFITAL